MSYQLQIYSTRQTSKKHTPLWSSSPVHSAQLSQHSPSSPPPSQKSLEYAAGLTSAVFSEGMLPSKGTLPPKESSSSQTRLGIVILGRQSQRKSQPLMLSRLTDWDEILSRDNIQDAMVRSSNAGQLARSRIFPSKAISVSSSFLKCRETRGGFPSMVKETLST